MRRTLSPQRALLSLSLVVALAGCGPAPSSATPTVGAPSVAPPPAATTPSAPGPPDSASTPPAASAPPSGSPAVPAFRHVYLIVMENHEFGTIVGDPRARYINTLIERSGLATNYSAVAHPSEPNYLALFAGSTFGVHDDGVYDLAGTNLADQLVAHGRTWHVYAQNVPDGCSRAGFADGPVDLLGAAGAYARKHEPAISFLDISGDPAACAHITGLAGFSPRTADFELIVPNQTNDMHDGTIEQGDAFLEAMVPRITSSADFADSLLLITWDEGSTATGGGGRVATIVVSDRVPPGFRSKVAHTHYSLLATIQEAWGLGCLRESCRANDLREFFSP
ncbi:MAG TPA: alkaline phosphatase family protein [Candidatus Limnocylindrales bacterium]